MATTLIQRLLLASLLLLGAASTATAQAQVEYYQTDAVGSVRVVTNPAGAVVRRHDYLPFGEEVAPQPCQPNGGTDARRFTGKVRDWESCLDYSEARYYRNAVGRFTSVDPILSTRAALVDPQQWNRYAYVRNNPVRYVDPDGREIWSPFQSAKPADFAPAAGFLTGVAMTIGNVLIGINSRGHAPPELEAGRFFEPTSTAEAVGMAFTNLGLFTAPIATGAFGGGLAVQENLALGRIAGSTLEATFSGGRAAVVRQVIQGKQPTSALTANERTLAATYYRSVATRTRGIHASDAARYNIARAEYLEGKRKSLSKTLPEFIENGFR